MVDSETSTFSVPPDRVANLRALVLSILGQSRVPFCVLERCVGKCRSMAVAVPCAILYTRQQYGTLAASCRGELVEVTKELREELTIWLDLDRDLVNGARWYGSEHVSVEVDLEGMTDASSRRWGGLVRMPGCIFTSAADFLPDEMSYHIGQKEAIALRNVLLGLAVSAPEKIRGKVFRIQVDNKGLYFSLLKGGSGRDAVTTSVCKELFWLQVRAGCVLKFDWVPSKDNEADALTRENMDNDIQLNASVFQTLDKKFGPFDIDLMASAANVQKRRDGKALPFYSQYYVREALATDVFSIDVRNCPWGGNRANNYCFPPASMIAPVINHLRSCKAKGLLLAPDMVANWGLVLAEGLTHSEVLAVKGQSGIFSRFFKGTVKDFQSKYMMKVFVFDFE